MDMVSSFYDSNKEDRDVILEYNNIPLNEVKPYDICGVPVWNFTMAEAIAQITALIEKGGVYHFISLDPYKLYKIKTDKSLKFIKDSAEGEVKNFATGAGVLWASKTLGSPLPETIPFFSFLMELIRLAEAKEYPLFFMGSKNEIVEKAFNNLKKSFPNLKIIGRHGGYFLSQREEDIVEAMRKSEPKIVFVGLGFPREDKWIQRIKVCFKNTIFISIGGSLDVISGQMKKAPDFFINRNLAWFYRIIIRPWRIGRFLGVLFFFFLVLLTKFFQKIKTILPLKN